MGEEEEINLPSPKTTHGNSIQRNFLLKGIRLSFLSLLPCFVVYKKSNKIKGQLDGTFTWAHFFQLALCEMFNFHSTCSPILHGPIVAIGQLG